MQQPLHHPQHEAFTGQADPQGSSKLHKRTYARALRRVERFGSAWHRGRRIGPDARLPSSWATRNQSINPRVPCSSQTSASTNHRRYRLHLLLWNTGGLGGGLYDELWIYLKHSQHDIVLLQETKWRFESTWEDADHYFVHSGSSAKDHCQGGLLTVISKRIVEKGSLRLISLHRNTHMSRVDPPRRPYDAHSIVASRCKT